MLGGNALVDFILFGIGSLVFVLVLNFALFYTSEEFKYIIDLMKNKH